MAGIVKVNRTTGRLCLNSSGQALRCACKCAQHCNIGTAGKSYTITSTGIALASCTCINQSFGCGPAAASLHVDRMPTANFNGTYTLDTYSQSDGTPPTSANEFCNWADTAVLDTCDYSAWQNTGCGPFFNIASYTNSPIQWLLTRGPSYWQLMLVGNNPNSPIQFPCIFPLLFIGTLSATEPQDCSGTLTFTNLVTSSCQVMVSPGHTSSSSQYFSIASGGTVVCTPNF